MASATALAPSQPLGQDHFRGEDFASLLDETLGKDTSFDGSVVTGRVVRLTDEFAIVDVGLKSEGRVALKEFGPPGTKPEVKPGDVIELYVERYEDRDGSIVLSREKARREEAWTNLEKAFETQQRVNGTIYGRVKGGFTVDLGGAVAFLPGSQVDIRPVRDVTPLMGTPQPFQILKMDRARGNIVVSRRAVLEETRAEQRSELIQGLKEGMILDGVVKNITDYGAFVDLGGVDGLLHVTDIAWRRINHPPRGAADRPAGQGAGDPLQLGNPAHQPGHEAARNPIRGKAWRRSIRRAPSIPAASPTSPTTAPSSSWSRASRAWCTSPRCRGPRRTCTPARSSPPARRWR